MKTRKRPPTRTPTLHPTLLPKPPTPRSPPRRWKTNSPPPADGQALPAMAAQMPAEGAPAAQEPQDVEMAVLPPQAEPEVPDEPMPEQEDAQPPHPFIFADPQQAAAHAAAMADPNAAPAPMFLFGAQAGAPMVAMPVPAAAIPAGIAAVLVVLMGGPTGPALGFIFPDIDIHAATPPTDRDLNPHTKIPAAAQREPAGPEDIGRVTKVQPSIGDFDRLIISQDRAEENVHADSLAIFNSAPELHLYGVLLNGGTYAFGKLHDLLEVVTNALTDMAHPQYFRVFTCDPAVAKYGPGGKTPTCYAGPIIFGIQITNAAARQRMCEHSMCAINKTYTFYMLGQEDFTTPWVGGMYATSVGGGTEDARIALCTAYSLLIWTNAATGHALTQYTWAFNKSSVDEKRYKLSQSVDVRWDPIMKAFMVYLKPCTRSAAHWHAIVDTLCGVKLRKSYFIFTPLMDPAIGPRCIICKNDMHFASTCPLPRDPQWWGPPDQISGLTEGPLAITSTSAGCGRGVGGHGSCGGRGRGG
ncbi:hypothetical protein FB451DRAFT_1387229 [Mycena latifolia]|nr:hypothetical protein FB451DRAFT_1387229 [Mycena latifolia]